jgi:hypothetical protein
MFETHVEEALSRAYIRAIAAHAGFNMQTFEHDYAVDGTFRQVKVIDDKYLTYGPGLDFQAKSSISCTLDGGFVNYDMKVPAYNKLVSRNRVDTSPCILILCCLSDERKDWVVQTESELTMKKCCYWAYLSGPDSSNKDKHRVKIPRANLFTPDTLDSLMKKIAQGLPL